MEENRFLRVQPERIWSKNMQNRCVKRFWLCEVRVLRLFYAKIPCGSRVRMIYFRVMSVSRGFISVQVPYEVRVSSVWLPCLFRVASVCFLCCRMLKRGEPARVLSQKSRFMSDEMACFQHFVYQVRSDDREEILSQMPKQFLFLRFVCCHNFPPTFVGVQVEKCPHDGLSEIRLVCWY